MKSLFFVLPISAVLLLLAFTQRPGAAQKPPANLHGEYAAVVQPLLKKYCLDCHSTKEKKGSLDLERFGTIEHVRKELKPWQQAIEMLEAHEMPPKEKPQPTAEERKRLVTWVRDFLDAEARALAGDPGFVPLRRLSNAEYDCTIRDLTGVDLRPTREFPADGAAGEGFTNAAEALADISPTLLGKYLNAAKDIADHAVLLPDGVRFSASKTRRDWTDESIAKLRAFYAPYGPDGKLAYQPYLAATVRHRDALATGKMTIDEVAQQEKLNTKYLGVLWKTLTDKTPSYPLDLIRARWQLATEKDVASLSADVAAWQTALWKYGPVGSYRNGTASRQMPNDPAVSQSQALRVPVKPGPGQNEVTLYLVARSNSPEAKGGHVIWQRPRFEAANKAPLLLRDYAQWGAAYEVDQPAVFAETAKYLAAAAESAHDPRPSADDLAKKHSIDAVLLKRWITVLALDAAKKEPAPEKTGKTVPAVKLDLLDEKNPKNDKKPALNGWRRKGTELPTVVTNASKQVEHIPGTIPPHAVVVHPTPKEFVAAVWTSPVAGRVSVAYRVTHSHPTCGNGIAWWLEHRHAGKASVLAEGVLDRGGEARPAPETLTVEKGDQLILAVDARNGNHFCDLTQIALTVSEADRTWDLLADVADTILEGNPHADRQGNKAVWSFVRGPTRPVEGAAVAGPVIPPQSLLGRWREMVLDPKKQAEAPKLAEQVQALLAGARPAKDPDRILYDNLVTADGVLLKGLDLKRFVKPRAMASHYGLDKDRFGRKPDGKADENANLIAAADTVTEIRLPAALFREREFVVDGRLDADAADRLVQFQVLTAPPTPKARWDGKGPIVGAAREQVIQGYAEFRRVFPTFLCFPRVVPVDEVVCLKMYHREDEWLQRLMLTGEQARQIDHLWAEHRFISLQPRAENKYLPQFIGFVSQDQPKELLKYYEGQRPTFQKWADEFEKDLEAAMPTQLNALLDFAARAYRRPVTEKERADLLALYRTLREKGAAHEEAFRGVLARILVAPGFLFRIEQAPAGKKPGPVNDWELATRLSYFLWSSAPDEELRKLAAAGRLSDPKVTAEQTRRLLADPRLRSFAIEFGTQWLHVRGFDEFNEKNEKVFPTFDANLRRAMYEESILFFQDLFQSDCPVTQILDADHTFLNESLAKHYGMPDIKGPQWRRVDGVRKYGRGGILGLASVQAKQSAASRTSPVLRGNWVVETLLGEKLPRPPANVPRLPEEEGVDKLTTRQQVEKHARVAECAVCHVRIDPFGFALERYDAIGRRRDKDLGGLVINTRAKLKDGTELEDIDGLRDYLLTKKKDVIVRLVCRKLLGYALGRATSLSDQPLIDEMVAELNRNDGKLSAAVLAIVRSPQFRMIRGSEFGDDN